MYCTKCGNKNDNNASFCVNCGSKLEKGVNTDNVSNVVNSNLKYTKLSITALVFLIISVLPLLLGNKMQFLLIFLIPFSIVSLILAIISKVKYKDEMAKIVMIIDIVVIAITIIALIYLLVVAMGIYLVGHFGGCW